MVHKSDQTISIVEALIDLANANQLKYINHDIYEDKEGKKLILTELGFMEENNYNYKLLYHSLDVDNKYLKSQLEAMKSERGILCGQNKELNGKTLLKARKILDGSLSDSEKVKELKKYLVI